MFPFFIGYIYMHLLQHRCSISPLKQIGVGMICSLVFTSWALIFHSHHCLINKPQNRSVYTIICSGWGGRKQLSLLKDVEIVESFPLSMCWNILPYQVLLSLWVAAVHSNSQMILAQSCRYQLEVSTVTEQPLAQKAGSDLQVKQKMFNSLLS